MDGIGSPRPSLEPAIALFSGTTEGRAIAQRLSHAGKRARVFVATEYGEDVMPELPGIEVHVGRLGVDAMRGQVEGSSVVIDATHPFATEASRTIREAAASVDARYIRVIRPDEDLRGLGPEDVQVGSAQEAARILAGGEGRALVTTGSKELDAFASVPGFAERVYARVLPVASVIDRCRELGLPASHIICMQGPFTRELNAAMLRQIGADWLVTKESGRSGGFEEKIAAAHDAGARAIVVRRPVEHEGGITLAEALRLIDAGKL